MIDADWMLWTLLVMVLLAGLAWVGRALVNPLRGIDDAS
jgi:hypothetical protein